MSASQDKGIDGFSLIAWPAESVSSLYASERVFYIILSMIRKKLIGVVDFRLNSKQHIHRMLSTP